MATRFPRRRPVLRPHGDEGQVLLLSIAFGVLALLLVTVVVSATGVHLERKRLLALTDLTALAAAAALDEPTYYRRDAGSDVDGLVVVTPESVRGAVEEHLTRSPDSLAFTDLRIVEATTSDGRTARVTLGATASPALVSWVTSAWGGGIQLQVTAQARAG